MALFTSNKRRQYRNIELTRILGRLLGYGLDLQTAISEVRSFAYLLGDEKIWSGISEDLRDGFVLSDALFKNSGILSKEDLNLVRRAEEEGTLPQALVNMASFIEPSFCDETEQATYAGPEEATVNMVNTVISDALERKAERVGLTLKPLIAEQNNGLNDTNEEYLDSLLSELHEIEGTEGASFHLSIMEAGRWQPYRQAPLMYFRPVVNCILYRSGLPYWKQDDMQGSFQIPFNEKSVDILVNYYPAKKELYIRL